MAGIDTNRGVNFQYACAIGMLLEFIEHPEWAFIQMEGEVDIEDAVVHDSANHIVLRAQIKQKQDPQQWRPNELARVLSAFAECEDSGFTSYRFIYSGSEGEKIAHVLRPILAILEVEGSEALSQDDVRLLTDLLGQRECDFLLRVANRFKLQHRDSWEAVKTYDILELGKLLLSSDHSYLEAVYDRAFSMIASHAEKVSKYQRRLDRAQILKLFDFNRARNTVIDFDITHYLGSFGEELENRASSVVFDLHPESSWPAIFQFVTKTLLVSDYGQGISLTQAVTRHKQVVLVGDYGSGKTTALQQLALGYCKGGRPVEGNSRNGNHGAPIPVMINLAGYEGESVIELIRHSLNRFGHVVTDREVLELGQAGKLLVLFDDYDAARQAYASELLLKIRKWCAITSASSMVLATHRPSDGYSLGLPTFRFQPLEQQQAEEILVHVLGIDKFVAHQILYGVSTDQRHLIENPLTLGMLAHVWHILGPVGSYSSGVLFRSVVDGFIALSETRGCVALERNEKLHLLSLLAEWMQNSETYHLALSVMRQMLDDWLDNERTAATRHLRFIDHEVIYTELISAGLLRITNDQLIEFIHPTFRSYVAALTIKTDDLKHLCSRNSWTRSLLMWASLQDRSISDPLVDLLSSNLELLARLLRERTASRKPVPMNEEDEKQYFARLAEATLSLFGRFPSMLRDLPWSHIPSNTAQALVARSSSGSFVFAWTGSTGSTDLIRWTTHEEIYRHSCGTSFQIPPPIWLIPADVMQRYHPIELAYLWLMRALYDLVVFCGWEGGFDSIVTPDPQTNNVHPAVTALLNRYILFRQFAEQMPEEIRNKLPFYANGNFDLAVEISLGSQPPIARYAIAPSQQPERSAVVVSPLGDANEPVFKQSPSGGIYFQVGETRHQVDEPIIETIGEVLQKSPGGVAQRWAKGELEKHLIGFPPQPW